MKWEEDTELLDRLNHLAGTEDILSLDEDELDDALTDAAMFDFEELQTLADQLQAFHPDLAEAMFDKIQSWAGACAEVRQEVLSERRQLGTINF